MLPEKTNPEARKSPQPHRPPEEQEDCVEKQQFTQVPNAHASGLGAMGRNDEKLPGATEDEGRPEPAY